MNSKITEIRITEVKFRGEAFRSHSIKHEKQIQSILKMADKLTEYEICWLRSILSSA